MGDGKAGTYSKEIGQRRLPVAGLKRLHEALEGVLAVLESALQLSG